MCGKGPGGVDVGGIRLAARSFPRRGIRQLGALFVGHRQPKRVVRLLRQRGGALDILAGLVGFPLLRVSRDMCTRGSYEVTRRIQGELTLLTGIWPMLTPCCRSLG